MGLYQHFFSEKSVNEEKDDIFTKPEKDYLKSLIQIVNTKYEQFEYQEIEECSHEIFYMPTKKQSYIGLQMGLSEQARLLKYNIRESQKIRASSKNFKKIYKKENRIIKIENFVNGRIDCIHLAYYEDGYRYLFPFFSDGHFYPTYISVTHYDHDEIIEEYMVQNNQILYEKYGKQKDSKVDYYYINFVYTGKIPVLEERSGYYLVDSLECVEKEYYVWTQNK